MGHPIGQQCVIVGPLGCPHAARCLGNVVTILGAPRSHPRSESAVQRITVPAGSKWQGTAAHYWQVRHLRPYGGDITSDDGDVVRQMTRKPTRDAPTDSTT